MLNAAQCSQVDQWWGFLLSNPRDFSLLWLDYFNANYLSQDFFLDHLVEFLAVINFSLGF